MDKDNFRLFVKLVGHILTGGVLCTIMGLADFGLWALGQFMASRGLGGFELLFVHVPAFIFGVVDVIVFVAWIVKGALDFLRELFK